MTRQFRPSSDTGRLRRIRDRAWARYQRRAAAGPLRAEAATLHLRLSLTVTDLERRIDYGRQAMLNPASVRRGIAAGQLGFDWSVAR